ncbi:MAG TPA: phosphoribosylglycinamide formyltransferase [Geobacteraceae bacterium]|nr:phosphoribosylglycinamide formyltransferase [Geobacteraceae bacterium]
MSGPLKIGVLVSGNGSNLQSIIDHAEKGKLDATVACVISNNAEAFALERARKHRIPAVYTDHRRFPTRESFDAGVAETFLGYGIRMVALAGFNRIISPVLLDAFPQAVMNIHPALLPAFPGSKAQRQALHYGVKITGCTVHFVDIGTDSGPIIIQAAVPVYETDTEESLSKRILTEEHKIYPRAIQLFAEGRLSLEGRKVIIKPPADPEGSFLENPSAKLV